MNKASIAKRALALIIDGALLSLVGRLFTGDSFSYFAPGMASGFTGILIAWAYFAFQDSSSKQATVGKRVMNLRVISQNGASVDLKQASLRYVGKLVSTALFFVGYIMAFFSSEGFTLHDRIASTKIIED